MAAVKGGDETDDEPPVDDVDENIEIGTFSSAEDFTWLLLLPPTTIVSLDGSIIGVFERATPHCESTVECGLIIRSDTEDADDESTLMVDFELVGDNCC